ncbi:hypothetical protein EDC04DRAFT_919303 [Pisolithus marmoratus]|nr:hypothetical protein EDC04DRAFT_919303 [Pisolithus marmoratus]
MRQKHSELACFDLVGIIQLCGLGITRMIFIAGIDSTSLALHGHKGEFPSSNQPRDFVQFLGAIRQVRALSKASPLQRGGSLVTRGLLTSKPASTHWQAAGGHDARGIMNGGWSDGLCTWDESDIPCCSVAYLLRIKQPMIQLAYSCGKPSASHATYHKCRYTKPTPS